MPGTPPDCSPPSEFCTSTCEEDGSGGHVCVVTAKDGDNDQHGDIRCTQDPSADDCDDGKDFVKPGAPELCDGLDNDCDNQADLDDGLTLGGTPTPLQGAFSAESVDLIWADGINRYALVWGGTGSEAPIRFTLLNQDGTRDGSIVELTPGHIGVDARPAVAYDGVSFMVAWVSDTTVLSYALIRSGAVFGSVQNLTRSGNIGGPDIIARPSGGFLLVWADTDTSYRARAQVIHHDGQLSGSELDLGQADFNRPPTVGTRLGNGQDLVVWDRTGVTYNLVNGSSALGGGVLDGSGDRPIAIGLDASDGALVAWKNGAATRIAYVDDTGTPGCGGSDLAGLGEPNSVVAGPGSETLLVTHSGGTLQLTRVNAAACTQIGSSLPISTGSLASFMFEATFARGNNGYLAVWPDNFNALQTRSLGPRLCD